MKVTVKKVDVKKGKFGNGETYLFTNVFVFLDDGKSADYVTIDSKVCHPDKIKVGMKADLRVSINNSGRATYFEPLGIQDESPNGVMELPGDAEIDVATGEVKENKK